MLVPLETLPGWPAAPPVSVLGTLALLVGIPLGLLLVFLIIAAVNPAPNSYDLMQQREALWVGSGAPEAITERPGSGHPAAIAAEKEGGAGRKSTGKGGASARW